MFHEVNFICLWFEKLYVLLLFRIHLMKNTHGPITPIFVVFELLYCFVRIKNGQD